MHLTNLKVCESILPEMSPSALLSQKVPWKKTPKYLIFLMKIVHILPRMGKQPNVFHICMDYIHIESKVALNADLPTPGNINHTGTAVPEAKEWKDIIESSNTDNPLKGSK